MIIKSANFEVSAVGEKNYPKNNLPELVLVGKSNVGKSSFVNTMISRKALARTSSTPGKTRQINFYNINNSFYFVDLPGYGYSKMSKKEQDDSGRFIENYLNSRNEIKLIIFLIDVRHEPTENDKLMYQYIVNTGFPCIIIANKVDKIAPSKVENAVKDLQNRINPLKDLCILPFSSEKKIYTDKVWKMIEDCFLL